jgi:hypothetical protein
MTNLSAFLDKAGFKTTLAFLLDVKIAKHVIAGAFPDSRE